MADWREHLGDRRVVASVSGGKDSAALSLWLHERGIDHDRVFLDTGWEHPDVYAYLRGPLAAAIGPIMEVRGPETMVEAIRRHGCFPSRARKFCTLELKIQPMAKHLASLGVEVVNAVGIRAEESSRRARMSEWDWNDAFDCETWRPLIQWSLGDVIAIHKRHGLAPCPLYLRGEGVNRLGCWPCINSTRRDLRALATDPERIALLRSLEAEMTERAGAPRAWFQARTGFNPETGNRDGRPWPIDRTMEWAFNGGQEELFEDPTPGCMRWGLCEATFPDNDKEAA